MHYGIPLILRYPNPKVTLTLPTYPRNPTAESYPAPPLTRRRGRLPCVYPIMSVSCNIAAADGYTPLPITPACPATPAAVGYCGT